MLGVAAGHESVARRSNANLSGGLGPAVLGNILECHESAVELTSWCQDDRGGGDRCAAYDELRCEGGGRFGERSRGSEGFSDRRMSRTN